MGAQARSVFLNFVTARRRLPGGDLRNLPVLPGGGGAAMGAGGASPLRRVSMGLGGRGTTKLSGRITVDASSGAVSGPRQMRRARRHGANARVFGRRRS